MYRRSVVIASGLLAGLSIACSPKPAPSLLSPAGDQEMPANLHGYRMTGSEPIPEGDGGGKLYRFSDGSAAYLTVFVYPIPDDVKQSTDSAQWVLIEGRKFLQVMPIQVQGGRYDAYETAFADPEPVPVEHDTIPGFVAAVVTRSRGVLSVQLEFLYLVHGQFLKIRATLPQDSWQQAPAPLFARDLAQMMYARDPR